MGGKGFACVETWLMSLTFQLEAIFHNVGNYVLLDNSHADDLLNVLPFQDALPVGKISLSLMPRVVQINIFMFVR